MKEFLESINEEKIQDYFFKIKKKFGRDVFGQGFLYRIITKEEIMDVEDLSEKERNEGINKEKKIYVKYDKGDKEGNRWYFETPYYIKWDKKTEPLGLPEAHLIQIKNNCHRFMHRLNIN